MYDQIDIDNPIETPTPPQPTKHHKSLKRLGLILLLLIAVAGIGYSVYSWQQNQSLQSNLNDQTSLVKDLNAKVKTLSPTPIIRPIVAVPVSTNVITIKELGVSITVPDTLKDLTYSYSSLIVDKSLVKVVQFSTQTLTDKYAGSSTIDGECSSFGMAPPLGALEKTSGQAPAVFASTKLVKQFSDSYFTYSGAQAACSAALKGRPAEADQLDTALSTLKQL